MSIDYRQTNIHWNYFLAIESDFENISRYIEFSESNNKTFSIELARIIMSSSQEIDGIMKKICQLIVNGSNSQTINDYKDIIKAHLPEFIIEEVQIPRFGMKSQPWIRWNSNDQNNNPFLWKANNKIKHDRTQHFEEANIQNAYKHIYILRSD